MQWIPVRKVWIIPHRRSIYWRSLMQQLKCVPGFKAGRCKQRQKKKEKKRKSTMQVQQSVLEESANYIHKTSLSLVLPVTLSPSRPRPVDCPLTGLRCEPGHVKTGQHYSWLKSGTGNRLRPPPRRCSSLSAGSRLINLLRLPHYSRETQTVMYESLRAAAAVIMTFFSLYREGGGVHLHRGRLMCTAHRTSTCFFMVVFLERLWGCG